MTKIPAEITTFLKIQTWVKQNAPDITFRPPVSPEALGNFSNKSGQPLPQQLQNILNITDGEAKTSAGMIGNWRLMPINEIQAAWGLLSKLQEIGAFDGFEPNNAPYIRKAWWHPTWIPIVSSDTGDYFCVDTAPPEPKREGQIILFLRDRPERVLVATDLSNWLDRIAHDLAQGHYKYHPEMGFDNEAFMRSSLEGKHLFDRYAGKQIVDKL
jgi:cell wall assembly regulator SMI1